MHPVDWLIVGVFIASLIGIALGMQRYTQSVADFLAANRCAKRYLLTAAEGAAGIGVISVVALFELFQAAGFTAAYWELVTTPLMVVLALAGWVYYRFRQTRCLTMAQFLEVRYSRPFRIFCGIVAFLSGIINYGIYPAVTARFFVHACDFPLTVAVLGWEIPTFALVMAALLGLGLYLTLSGGQITVMVTDFVQGQFLNIVFVVASVVVLMQVSWAHTSEALAGAPANASMVNPFDTAEAETFSFWFFLMILFGKVYTYMAWQGSQGYNASAKTPHEARMARIFGQWRGGINVLIPLTFALCAFVTLHHPSYSGQAAVITAEIQEIGDAQIQGQMTTPIAMRHLLPAGVLGLFVAVMLAAGISSDSTYLHSWGSIFIQDVIMPFRRRPFSPRVHLFLLRLSIVGVMVFVFLFSLLFRQTEYILLFFQLTGAFFTAGAGTCIIGGLYWSRGTAAGAWAAMATGMSLVVLGFWLDRAVPEFPLNYLHVVFIAQLASILSYVLVSLLTGRGRTFDLDRMLHRGKYAVRTEEPASAGPASRLTPLQVRLGLTDDFTRGDRMIYYATLGFAGFLLSTFAGVLAWNFLAHPSHAEWMAFWRGFLLVKLGIAVIVTLWILAGGCRDLRDLLRDLKTVRRDAEDDGFVTHGHNAGEEKVFAEIAREEGRLRETAAPAPGRRDKSDKLC